MSITRAHEEADRVLDRLSKTVLPLKYLAPLDQKQAFLNGDISKPDFSLFVNQPSFHPAEVSREITSLRKSLPDDTLGHLLDKKAQTLSLENRLIAHRNQPEIVRSTSKTLYGSPDETLLEQSRAILEDEKTPVEPEKNYRGEDVAAALKDTLQTYGLSDWTVELNSTQYQTNVEPAKGNIKVHERRLFSEEEIRRLQVHEVGVHALRAHNGMIQPIVSPFSSGYLGSLPTEEGLATYAEEVTGVASKNQQRQYAARVLAVDAMLRGSSFSSTFSMLRDYQFSDDQAYTMAARVFRGGGLTKDYIYAAGNGIIKDYLEHGGNLSTLYTGKIAVEDADTVEQLVSQEILEPPETFPSFFRDKK